MKILVLANNQIGLYKFRRELLQEMIAHKYRVYISTPEDVLSEEISSLGCKLIINKYLDRRGTDPIEDFRLLLYYKKLMEKVLPDIVLTYTIKPNVYGGLICRIKRIPYIANVTGLGTSIENGGLLQALTLTLYKVGLKKANAVFFQNHDNLNFMLKHHIVKRENVKLIPGSGVNTKDNGYEEYPPSDEAVIFSTFGRIMKDKGIDELLGAAEKVKRDHKECTFQLVGDFDENYEDMVKNKVTQGIV